MCEGTCEADGVDRGLWDSLCVHGLSPDSVAGCVSYGCYGPVVWCLLKCFYSRVCCIDAMTVCNVSLSFCICITGSAVATALY